MRFFRFLLVMAIAPSATAAYARRRRMSISTKGSPIPARTDSRWELGAARPPKAGEAS